MVLNAKQVKEAEALYQAAHVRMNDAADGLLQAGMDPLVIVSALGEIVSRLMVAIGDESCEDWHALVARKRAEYLKHLEAKEQIQ